MELKRISKIHEIELHIIMGNNEIKLPITINKVVAGISKMNGPDTRTWNYRGKLMN